LIRTLHTYISRELLRVGALALVAFTVVMTICAIIEPLRKEVLSTAQALAFFGYTLPVMLSLTLPVAALFAATIVYGRFSQDNELLACRASGISTISLLKPALVLGGVVTLISLGLNNFLAPQLAAMGERAVRENVRDIAFHRLKSREYLDLQGGRFILHADKVFPSHNALRGVVAVDTSRQGDQRMLVASEAHVNFEQIEGLTYCSVYLSDVAVVRTSTNEVYWEESQQTPPRPLPTLTRDKAAFFDWRRLLSIRSDPTRHPEIHRALVDIRRDICKMTLAKEIVEAVNAGREYQRLRYEKDVYAISAGRAELGRDGSARLYAAPGPDGETRRVKVAVMRDGNVRQRIVSDSGKVEAVWLSGLRADEPTWLVEIELDGPAEVYFPFLPEEPYRRGGWRMGQCAMPQEIPREVARVRLADLYDRAEAVTANKFILQSIERLKGQRVPKLLGRVRAEIHGRLSYCLSCFLLVAMGAALGIIFRGGQMISAFTLSMIPAAAVIVLVLMGKEILSNPDSPNALGVMSIWAGDLGLLIANGIIYWRLMRR